MWTPFIVTPSQPFDDNPRFGQAAKDLGIQALPTKRAIEAFVTPVLLGFAWRDVGELHTALLHFLAQCLGIQLAAIVHMERQ